MTADRILMHGLCFFGHHGVFEEERRLGQRFVVDVEMEVDAFPAARDDDVGKTVDYGAVYADVKRIVEGPPNRLIEAVAERVARCVLEKYAVRSVLVRVKKLQIPLGDALDFVAVEIERRRGEQGS